HYLSARGFGVTLYDALPQLGGMMTSGIPDYRLPNDALARDIEYALSPGVDVRTGVMLGRDVYLEDLRRDYDAVFLAMGAHSSYALGIPGDDLPGVYGGVEFLREVNLGQRSEAGRRVAVVGGGNAAVDAARTALRLGAEEVTILYRRLREDMPAEPAEIKAAEEEGVRIEFLTGPVEAVGDGKVEWLRCVRMQLGDFDKSGRRRPVPEKGSEYDLPVDMVISAIGQCVDGFTSEICADGKITADPETLATPLEGVFAGGDAVTGPATVIDAIGAGKRAAEVISGYLLTGSISRPLPRQKRASVIMPVEDEVPEAPRLEPDELDATLRAGNFREVVLSYTREAAMAEAARCLKCHAQSE
ncbi:MAG: FAD-dependent oxidoreductase, partial [bacterium]|nr:FAD-dependent oxidoreductase [bacterium]